MLHRLALLWSTVKTRCVKIISVERCIYSGYASTSLCAYNDVRLYCLAIGVRSSIHPVQLEALLLSFSQLAGDP